MSKIVPVILCGGSGTRLWPLSRKETPKQFLTLTENESLLQQTINRTRRILGDDGYDIVTVALRGMKDSTAAQLAEISPRLLKHLLLEPQARNTAAAVAFSIQYVQQTFGSDALLWILPADHFIGNPEALGGALKAAQERALEGYLVTFGIQPTRPETGYGYIQRAEAINGSGSFAVRSFIEKPERAVAEQFMESGEHLWSSGMHLFRIDTAEDHFLRHASQTWNVVRNAMRESSDFRQPSMMTYGAVREEPFEIAVMEKSDKIAVVPCDPQWSDIGCWESLWEIRPKDSNGNAVDGDVICHDTRNSMILAQDRLVTCVGLENVVVVETGDSILVAHRESNGSLKKMVEALQLIKRRETMQASMKKFKWGHVRPIADSEEMGFCELVVRPGQFVTRNELGRGTTQWVVASGEAVFHSSGGMQKEVQKNDSFTSSSGRFCRISNVREKEDLRLYELHYKNAEVAEGTILPFPLERNRPASAHATL